MMKFNKDFFGSRSNLADLKDLCYVACCNALRRVLLLGNVSLDDLRRALGWHHLIFLVFRTTKLHNISEC